MFSIRPGKRLAANRCVRMMRLPFTLCLLALAMQVHATVVDTRFNPQFNPLFDDRAVLQRDRPIRVWGSAPPLSTHQIGVRPTDGLESPHVDPVGNARNTGERAEAVLPRIAGDERATLRRRAVMSLRWRCELGNPAHVGNQR
jgi:hypothetical protein